MGHYTLDAAYMKFKLQLSPRLEQRQMMTLTPLLIQRFQFLRQPYEHLIEKVSEAVKNNVMLEFARDDVLMKRFRPSTSVSAGLQDDFLENRADRRELTLQQFLAEQLAFKGFDEPDRSLVEGLLSALDERGYLRDYPQIKVELMQKHDVSRVKVDQALGLLQEFEPEGVGARNLKECLLLQVKAHQFDSESLRQLLDQVIRGHLHDLADKNFSAVAKALNIPAEGVPVLAAFIEQNLTPNPGLRFASERDNRYVVPSLVVRKNGERYVIDNLEQTQGFKLKVSDAYLAMLDAPSTDDQTRAYLKEQLQSAREFLEHLEQRGQTINQIAETLAETQQMFFEKGIHWLMPLPQSELASKIGVHPSTISRAVSDKYIQTPHGLVAVKLLLPRRVSGVSVQYIKRRLVDHVHAHPEWSDRQLEQALTAHGIRIKRRTVNKYRHELLSEGRVQLPPPEFRHPRPGAKKDIITLP